MYEILWLYFGRLLILLALICTVALKIFEDSSFVDGKLSTKNNEIFKIFMSTLKNYRPTVLLMHCILEHCKNHGNKFQINIAFTVIYCQSIFADIRCNEHVKKESSLSPTLVGMQ